MVADAGENPLSFPPEPESRVGVGGTSGRWKPPPTRSHGPESAALPEIKLAKISTSWDDICLKTILEECCLT